MALTLGNFVGFETGGLEEAEDTAGTPSIQTTYARNSGYAARFNGGAGNNYRIEADAFGTSAGNNHIFGFYLYIVSHTLGDGIQRVIVNGLDANTVELVKVAIKNISGSLYIGLGDVPATVFSYGSTALSTGTWYFVEVIWPHSNSGTATLYLDGSSECTKTGDFFQTSSDMSRYALDSTASIDFVIDDFYCYSGATDVNDFLGDCEIYAHVVNETTATPDYGGVVTAATAATGGTGTPTGRWDETDDYLESTYIIYGEGAGGGADGITLNASITEDPTAIKAMWRMKKSTATTGVTHYGVIGNSGDGVVNTADLNPSTAYATYTYGSDSATVKPLASEEIRLGVEVVE